MNPKSHEIDAGVAAFRERQADLIIAIGGGSAIDTAKLIRACDVPHVPAAQVIAGAVEVGSSGPPLLAIPTTAGTGSETTHFSAVYVDRTKHSLADPSMHPNFAILDERFLRSMPVGVTRSTALDATCQAIESMWSIRATDRSRRFARRALRLAWEALPRCLSHPTDRSRRAMLVAAHLAGRAIDQTQTTACHALSYALTAHYGLAHGEAVALMLAPVWEFNANVSDADAADRRGAHHVRTVMRETAALIGAGSVEAAPAVIRRRLRDLRAPVTLAEAGLPGASAVELIARSVDAVRVGNNPRRLQPAQVPAVLACLLDRSP